MPQFLVKKGDVAGSRAVLLGEEAHHARDVVRLKAGDAIRLFDAEGTGYEGRIASVTKFKLEIDVLRTRTEPPPAAPRLALGQSVLPRDAMDWSVWKATELGVDEILPIVTERSVARADKRDHWEKAALGACKQSGRLRAPLVHAARKPQELDLSRFDLVLVGSLEKDARPLAAVLEKASPQAVLALVGPEGDFAAAEMKLFRDRGAKPVTLGNETLKSETAALYMLSALKFKYSPH